MAKKHKKNKLTLGVQLEVEVWFTAEAGKDLAVSVFESGTELGSKTFTYDDLWSVIERNKFWDAEEREEVRQKLISRMRALIRKLELKA